MPNNKETYTKIKELCASWWHEHPLAKQGIKYDPNEEFWNSELIYQTALVIFVKEKEEVVGCYAGMCMPYYFSKRLKMCSTICWCIKKEYRGTRAAYQLLQYIQQVMTTLGINIWGLDALNSEPFIHVGPLLEKAGYINSETHYIKIQR